MKNENFNVHLRTLDDQVLYREICKKIREIESVNFRLFLTVPLFSWGVILVLWLEYMKIPPVLTIISGVFGALITYFIFCWERQNKAACQIFRKHAAILERRKNRQEKINVQGPNEGPYTLINKMYRISPEYDQEGFYSPDKDMNAGKETRRLWSGWGKTEAETAVYLVTILFWILTVILGVIRIYVPSLLGYAFNIQPFTS